MRSILLVDDELTISEVVELALSMHGFDVTIAQDGRDALAHLATHRPDVVLSDIMMPYIGGLELARTIQETPSLRGIPVILMSASGRPPKDANNTYTAFLAKPFDVDQLVGTLERVLAGDSDDAEPSSNEANGRVTNGNRPGDRP
jgi:CheY-like chemotaxis protein